MNMMGLAIGVAATGLAVAIAERAPLKPAPRETGFAPGCTVPAAVPPGYLPRAALAVENRRSATLRLWLEARAGTALPAVELGTVGPNETRVFPHALPAGQNRLSASAGDARTEPLRYRIDVVNRGAGTCTRRYLWRVL